MTILHISQMKSLSTNGVATIVPYYVYMHNAFAKAALFDLNDVYTEKNITKFSGKEYKVISELPSPFDKPDLVVFHEVYKIQYIRLYKECIKKKIQYIIVPHGSLTKYAQNHKKLKKILGNRLLFKKFARSSACIQFLNQNEKEKSIYNDNSIIIGNAIDDIPKKNIYLTRKKEDQSKLKLVYVGRYDYFIKGLDQLLEAMKLVKRYDKNIELNLYGVGDKKNLKYIKKYIEKNFLQTVVNVNGPVYGKEKRNIILENDAFIQVSRSEGQPLGVMEAMCLGLPVILSIGTGYKEIVNKYSLGKLVETNSKSIYNAINSLNDNKQELEMYSMNSFEFAKKRYSSEFIINESKSEYEKILKNRHIEKD